MTFACHAYSSPVFVIDGCDALSFVLLHPASFPPPEEEIQSRSPQLCNNNNVGSRLLRGPVSYLWCIFFRPLTLPCPVVLTSWL